MPTPTPAQLEIVARANKRLPGLIARRGVDELVLQVAAAYDDMYATAAAPNPATVDDLMDVALAVREPVLTGVVSLPRPTGTGPM